MNDNFNDDNFESPEDELVKLQSEDSLQVPPRDVKELMEEAIVLFVKVEEVKSILDDLEEEQKKINSQILNYFKAQNLSKADSNDFIFTKEDKFSISLPKMPEDKKLFFDWLTKEGLYWAQITVNSKSFNKIYNEKFTEAVKEKQVLEIPGLPKPFPYSSLKIKRAPKKKTKLGIL